MRALTRTFLTAAAVASAALAGATPAHADFLSPAYDPRQCRADSMNSDGTAFLERTNVNNVKKIKNVSGSAMDIYCPIVKMTSKPGVSNDAFKYADIPVEIVTGTVTCRVKTFDSSSFSGASNLLASSTGSRSTAGAGTLRVTASGGQPTGYFTANNGTGYPFRWYYMDMTCTLPNGASIGGYQVSEGGAEQPGYRIYPAVNCAPDTSNNMLWRYLDASGTFGGVIMGQSTGITPPAKFAMKCAVPNNSVVDFSVTPAGIFQLGCNLDNASFSSFTWVAQNNPNSSAWPSKMLRQEGGTQPVIAVPISQTHNLYCGQNQDQGDGQLISYRAKPTPNRSGWAVQGSTGGTATNATDNIDSTRWTTGGAAAVGNWFRINFGSVRTVNQLTMDSGSTSADDYARGFEVQVSPNGTSGWTTVATGAGTSRFISISFPQQTTQHIRVRLTQAFSKWWSIHEINAYKSSDDPFVP
jgi:hypothetical protein